MGHKSIPQEELWTSERCFVTELINQDDYPEVSIARIRVEAGATTQLHALSVAEWYVIEAGIGLMYVGDAPARNVVAGSVVTIAKHESQRIKNTGRDDLVFLCVCAPRFLLECYTSLE